MEALILKGSQKGNILEIYEDGNRCYYLTVNGKKDYVSRKYLQFIKDVESLENGLDDTIFPLKHLHDTSFPLKDAREALTEYMANDDKKDKVDTSTKSINIKSDFEIWEKFSSIKPSKIHVFKFIIPRDLNEKQKDFLRSFKINTVAYGFSFRWMAVSNTNNIITKDYYNTTCATEISIYEIFPEILPEYHRYDKVQDKIVPDVLSKPNTKSFRYYASSKNENMILTREQLFGKGYKKLLDSICKDDISNKNKDNAFINSQLCFQQEDWSVWKSKFYNDIQKPKIISNKNKYDRNIFDKNDSKKSITVDVYDVLDAFDVKCPALQHLIKKALCAGLRGHKNIDTDLQDISNSALRAIELAKKR